MQDVPKPGRRESQSVLLVGGLIEDGGCIFGVGKMELANVGGPLFFPFFGCLRLPMTSRCAVLWLFWALPNNALQA